MRRYRRYEHNGYEFRSGLELEVAKLLAQHSCEYQYENMRIPYWVKPRGGMCRDCSSHNVVVKRDYTPDFYLPDTNVIVEVKGKFTAKDRKKHAAIKEQLPLHDIRMWFSRDDKLHKNTDKRNSDWCKDHDIPYHIGITKVPLSWLRKTT